MKTLGEILKEANGDPSKIFESTQKMMDEMNLTKNSQLEIPIIVTRFSKEEITEVDRLMGKEEAETEITESQSLATIDRAKISSYHKITFDEVERTIIVMDNGIDYECALNYKEFKDLLSVG